MLIVRYSSSCVSRAEFEPALRWRITANLLPGYAKNTIIYKQLTEDHPRHWLDYMVVSSDTL